MELVKIIWQGFIKLKAKQKERKNVNMKNRKMNNKGFSLVELIIVIAIMAVLVGVLAPAYLRYVEKSRKSADIQAIDSITVAMEATAMGPEFALENGDKMLATFTDGKLEFSVEPTNHEKKDLIVGELKAIIPSYETRSNDFKNFVITGTVNQNGTVTFKVSGSAATAITDYSTLEGRLTK